VTVIYAWWHVFEEKREAALAIDAAYCHYCTLHLLLWRPNFAQRLG
jgi:hypothetical protein